MQRENAKYKESINENKNEIKNENKNEKNNEVKKAIRNEIKNPVIKGFNPDPSICRVGDIFYIATSTFEWYPGVAIYSSKDLEHWTYVTSPLDETNMCLIGIDSACGIWAPNLTYDNGRFYLLYTNVLTNRSRYKDTHNFMIEATSLTGEWSEPVFLNKSGFDPSLFHDPNGKKWVVNMTIDHRVDRERFSGIWIQEYSEEEKTLIGPVHKIFKGTAIGTTEGPNIVFHNGYYYLTVAEGGTEFGHCVCCARSKSITGPYEESPYNPIMTTKDQPDSVLQRAGHGQLIQGKSGAWYMSHLCSRTQEGYSVLGRETAIVNIEWDEEGWYHLAGKGKGPMTTFISYEPRETLYDGMSTATIFEKKWAREKMCLRTSFKSNGIEELPGNGIRLRGMNSLSSKYEKAFLAMRIDELTFEYQVHMSFEPNHYHHMAGLACYYNEDNYHYMTLSREEEGLRFRVITADRSVIFESKYHEVEVASDYHLVLRCEDMALRFGIILDGTTQWLEGTYDFRILSDEYVEGNGFTGAMVGIACQDLRGDGCEARFSALSKVEEK